MAIVNPDLLKPKANGVVKAPLETLPTHKRSMFTTVLTLARRQLEQVLLNIVRTQTVKVQLTEADRLVSKLDAITAAIKNLPKIDMGDSPASINIQTMSEKTISRLTQQLEDVRKAVVATKPDRLPKVQQVKIINPTPPVQLPISPLIKKLEEVEQAIGRIKLEVPKQQEIKIPALPKTIGMAEGKAILKALQEVAEKLDGLPKEFPEVHIPTSVEISNFPPQKYPMPVTNININPLRGFAKSNVVALNATTPAPLPGEVLAYRRSIIMFNSHSATVYIGGSDVSAANGLPVLANSYSPALDAGPKMIIYGITGSGSGNVRVLEVSNENIGN